MAKAKKRRTQFRRRYVYLTIAVCLLLAFAAMYLNALIVHVRYAEVTLTDLSAEFDGTTILFVSDIDISTQLDLYRTTRVMKHLQALHPDLLLLGGDFTSPGLVDRIKNEESDLSSLRTQLFLSLRDFQAPLGKFAVRGEQDGEGSTLSVQMTESGVRLLDDSTVTIPKNGTVLYLTGISPDRRDLNRLTGTLRKQDCSIALTHSPNEVSLIRTAESADGGNWNDLTLSGHTHGGQLRIGDHSALKLDEAGKRFISGWYTDGFSPLLVSQGLGCEAVDLRLGTHSEVWFITLRTDGE